MFSEFELLVAVGVTGVWAIVLVLLAVVPVGISAAWAGWPTPQKSVTPIKTDVTPKLSLRSPYRGLV